MNQPTIGIHVLGRTQYRDCWELQQLLLDRRVKGEIEDTLLLTEHAHVYTIGRNGTGENLLVDAKELSSIGAEAVHVDRGGDITYHGPGQLVGYPVMDLQQHSPDLHWYLRQLEEVIIRSLARCGIHAGRDEKYTGVWTHGMKICAIGVKTSRWVTMHGFALNVDTDLSYFDKIIPCGIADREVTSMTSVSGKTWKVWEVASIVADSFCDVFDLGGEHRSIVGGTSEPAAAPLVPVFV